MRNKQREKDLLLIENRFKEIWSLLPCQILIILQLDFYLGTLQINSDWGSLDVCFPTWQQEPVDRREKRAEQPAWSLGSVIFWILVLT